MYDTLFIQALRTISKRWFFYYFFRQL